MSQTITLAIPEAPARTTAFEPTRKARGSGIRLGLLDNSKPNAELLLRGLLERAAASAKFASVLFVSKPNAALQAPGEVLDQLAQGADVVVSAMGD